MNRSFAIKLFIVGALSVASAFLYQDCGQNSHTFAVKTVSSMYGSIECVTFSAGDQEACADSGNGMIGKLYYLLDKTNGATIAANLYDKNNVAIPFDATHLNSVNVLISRGYSSGAYILMPQVDMPAVAFTSGFELASGSTLQDSKGKTLIEAFALDLHGDLQLAPGQEAGRYEIAVLSDDGSLVDADLNDNGNFQTIIDNDGYHSPRLKCASQELSLQTGKKIPLRLRYYQGPRTTIALTLVMRKLTTGELAGLDTDCDFTDSGSGRWFGGVTTDPGYVPDLKNSKFGALLARGWFIPPKAMFALPETL